MYCHLAAHMWSRLWDLRSNKWTKYHKWMPLLLFVCSYHGPQITLLRVGRWKIFLLCSYEFFCPWACQCQFCFLYFHFRCEVPSIQLPVKFPLEFHLPSSVPNTCTNLKQKSGVLSFYTFKFPLNWVKTKKRHLFAGDGTSSPFTACPRTPALGNGWCIHHLLSCVRQQPLLLLACMFRFYKRLSVSVDFLHPCPPPLVRAPTPRVQPCFMHVLLVRHHKWPLGRGRARAVAEPCHSRGMCRAAKCHFL